MSKTKTVKLKIPTEVYDQLAVLSDAENVEVTQLLAVFVTLILEQYNLKKGDPDGK